MLNKMHNFFERELSGQSFWWLIIGIALGVLVSLLSGCAAHKPPRAIWINEFIPSDIATGDPQWVGHWGCTAPYVPRIVRDLHADHLSTATCERPDHWHHKPTRAPLMPKDRDCGAPIAFENGETWLYPCWPEKSIPKCLGGCAAHKPPKIGAPPTWKPDTPFGGKWDCHSDKYERNPKTGHCELKPGV